jgi:hypothetical protein
MLDLYRLLLLKKLSGDSGGGGDISLETLTVSANGTTNAPSGTAFNKVVASVPNSYAAADEGKVVSSGALVSQTEHAQVTQNGTIDTTLNNSVEVAVPVPTLESKSIAANGTYTPESGKAWNEVVVNVTAGLPAYVTKIKEYTQAENWLSDTYGNAKNFADTYMDATDMTENRFRIAYVSNNNATNYQASVLWVWKKGASTVSAEGYYKNNYSIRSYIAGASFWISAGAKITVIYLSDTYRDPAGV